MLFSKDIKNLRIYRQKMFLPTLENSDSPNKKTKSAIFLLTPNRKSSVSLMKHPLLVNMRRYQSYYIERDLTYFIQSSKLNSDGDLEEEYIYPEDNLQPVNEQAEPGAVQHVSYEGFSKDVQILMNIFTEDDYRNIIEFLGIDAETIEKFGEIFINLVVGNFPDIDKHFSFFVNHIEKDGVKCTEVTIHVPRCDGGEAINSYDQRISNFVAKAMYLTIHPEDLLNQKANVFADTYTDADTSFNGTDPANYTEDVYESAAPITIENLGTKFKYQSTTKFKQKISKKINQAKRDLKDIKFSPEISTPSMPTSESVDIANWSALSEFEEGKDYMELGNNRLLMFTEDAKYDMQLKKLLWKDRIKKRQQILEMDKEIKIDCPDIMYAFPELDKYKQKNMFVDLYFYNQTFFKNNTWKLKRGFDLYLDLSRYKLFKLFSFNEFLTSYPQYKSALRISHQL